MPQNNEVIGVLSFSAIKFFINAGCLHAIALGPHASHIKAHI